MIKLYAVCYLGGVLLFSGCAQAPEKSPEVNQTTQQSTENPASDIGSPTNELTPEEVLAGLEEPTPEGPLKVTIVEPDAEQLMKGQAQSYRATLDNYPSGGLCTAKWVFHLNEYAEETVFQEQETNCNSGQVHSVNHVDGRGDLRLELVVEISDLRTKEILQTATAERLYRVE